MLKVCEDRARAHPRRVVLPEGGDPRILQAAAQAAASGLALPFVLLPDDGPVRLPPGVDGCRAADLPRRALVVERIASIRGLPLAAAEMVARHPLFLGAALVRIGVADALVAGVAHPTRELLMACEALFEPDPQIQLPSSFFLMDIPGWSGSQGTQLVFADCAGNPQPSANELASIALATARSTRDLLGWTPRVAMLSFSTLGSAEHPDVDKVRKATALLRQAAPDLAVDGELQLDTALIPSIAAKKMGEAPRSAAGHANILIFPDLDAATIGYKLVQRLAKAAAYGPVIQGFRQHASDLSRGATVDDIVGTLTLMSAMDPHSG